MKRESPSRLRYRLPSGNSLLVHSKAADHSAAFFVEFSQPKSLYTSNKMYIVREDGTKFSGGEVMRKAILSLCLIIGSLSALFGSTNMQKIYPIDSSEYEAIKVLLVHQGLALPSTAG